MKTTEVFSKGSFARLLALTGIMVLTAAIATGCDDGARSADGPVSEDAAQAPPNPTDSGGTANSEAAFAILGIEPLSGPAGTVITIAADGFDPETDTITFGPILEISSGQPIQMTVPEDATVGAYAVALHRDAMTSNEIIFEVVAAPAASDGGASEGESGGEEGEESGVGERGAVRDVSFGNFCTSHPEECYGFTPDLFGRISNPRDPQPEPDLAWKWRDSRNKRVHQQRQFAGSIRWSEPAVHDAAMWSSDLQQDSYMNGVPQPAQR